MITLDIVRLVCGPYQANSFLVSVKDGSDALLIDPGDDYPLIARAVSASGKRLTDILLTHGHFDHVLSAGRMARETGARVHIHPLDADMLLSARSALYDPGASNQAFEPFQPDVLFDLPEKSTAEIAGIEWRYFHCPGHTPGGMSFYAAQAGLVFTGDTLFENAVGRTDFPGGNERQLFDSVRMLLALPNETVVHPGHGNSATIGQILEGWQ